MLINNVMPKHLSGCLPGGCNSGADEANNMRENVYDRYDENNYCSQGNAIGIRSLGFRSRSPNKEADELGLHKDGFSRRGVPPCFRRPVDNAKKRGLKALPKSQKRLSLRFW